MVGASQSWEITAEQFSELLARREREKLADLRRSQRLGLLFLSAADLDPENEGGRHGE